MTRGERALIDHIQATFAAVGAWDARQGWVDAVRLPGAGIVASVDAGVAGRHFPWPCAVPSEAGQRVLRAAASDLAPVGAHPVGFLLAATLPVDAVDTPALWDLFHGMAAAAAALDLPLLGGNVTVGELALALTVFGDGAVTRAGRGPLRDGDLLWLSGNHGDAAAALYDIRDGRTPAAPLAARYWRPLPRLAWGRALWSMPFVVGAIDVSDGWLLDLHNLARTGGCGLHIDAAAVPRSADWRATPAVVRAASYWGGDDYELAFATRGVARADVAMALAAAGIDAACVGRAASEANLTWSVPPEFAVPAALGYDPYAAATAAV